jgi:serine/threonine-protein kinase
MVLDNFLKNFEIIQTFKETGQKRVYLAEHSNYGEVIVKIGRSPSKQGLKRAKREVETQKYIDSPYYPKNLDFIIFDDLQFAIVEEYIVSKPLSECYARFSDPVSILKLLQALVSGLDLLWRVRITHRDLKPDNILIRDDGSPVIIDLGIILAIEQTDLTYSFAPFSPCTPRYAAPEQLKNRRAEIDHRTDQFILGIDVMELIGGGVHPFDPSVLGCGNSIPENIINNKWTKEKLDCADFLSIKDFLYRLLAPEPYLRFRNTDILQKEIKRCCEAYK